MKLEKLHGVVLKRINYADADKIITVYTAEKGKVVLLAKGIRKIKSRRAPHLELFNLVRLTVHPSKSFGIITEAKVDNDYSTIKSNLMLSGYLFYIAEVIDKLLPEYQSHPEILDLLLNTLTSLGNLNRKTADQGKKSQEIVKQFVIPLLWILGFLPHGEYPKIGVSAFVESLIERPIKSRNFLEKI